jgi:agmatinase
MSGRDPGELSPTGVATFYKAPLLEGLDDADGTIAFLGVPHDLGVGYRPGARFGPRAVREASTRLGPIGAEGYFDVERGRRLLAGRRLVDAGDVNVLRSDPAASLAAVEAAVGRLVDAGAFPVVFGGDHSATGAAVRALAAGGADGPAELCVLQIDAHLDFTADVAGNPHTSSSPLRRASETSGVGRILQVGIRGPRTPEDAYRDALANGNLVLTREQLRTPASWEGLLEALASCPRCYVTLDMDAFDPALAPGVSSPEPDGLDYREVRRLLRETAQRTQIVAFDVMETNPMVDPGSTTAYLAALAALEFLGAIF